jgi:hypothetical protein
MACAHLTSGTTPVPKRRFRHLERALPHLEDAITRWKRSADTRAKQVKIIDTRPIGRVTASLGACHTGSGPHGV